MPAKGIRACLVSLLSRILLGAGVMHLLFLRRCKQELWYTCKYDEIYEGTSNMVDPSVNSPRRMLSLSRERAFVSILDDEKDGKAVLSNKQGANTSEVYGFVGSISTIVVIGLFFLWAYLPEPWLHYLGITYYPSRYWALALPTYALVTIIFFALFYLSLNCMATVPAASWSSLFDEHTREASRFLSAHASTNEEHPIDPISDIQITEINARMFGLQK